MKYVISILLIFLSGCEQVASDIDLPMQTKIDETYILEHIIGHLHYFKDIENVCYSILGSDIRTIMYIPCEKVNL